MCGSAAPDNLQEGAVTQVWLASGKDAAFTGKYFFHLKAAKYSSLVDDVSAQELLLKRCMQCPLFIFLYFLQKTISNNIGMSVY